MGIHDARQADLSAELAAFGCKSLISAGAKPQDMSALAGLVYVGNDETKQCLVAALSYWKEQGMCEPTERSDEVHDLATAGGEVTSASEEDVEALIAQLNNIPTPLDFHQQMAGALMGIDADAPIVVVEIKGGALCGVRTSMPMDVVTVGGFQNAGRFQHGTGQQSSASPRPGLPRLDRTWPSRPYAAPRQETAPAGAHSAPGRSGRAVHQRLHSAHQACEPRWKYSMCPCPRKAARRLRVVHQFS